jgi:hypothetical protein
MGALVGAPPQQGARAGMQAEQEPDPQRDRQREPEAITDDGGLIPERRVGGQGHDRVERGCRQ